MKKIYLFILFCTFFVINGKESSAQMAGSSIFLPGHYLEIGQENNGSLGPACSIAGYYPHPSSFGGTNLAMVYDYGLDGWTVGSPQYMGDYTYPGTPFEGWEMQVNGTRSQAFYSSGTGYVGGTLTGNNVSYVNAGGRLLANWAGSCGGLTINTESRIDTNESAVVFTTIFRNPTGSPILNVYFLRSADPDNDESWAGGSFSTNNMVNYQNDVDHRVMATGTAISHSFSTYSVATKDCRAVSFFYNSWPLSSSVDLATCWNQTFGIPGSAQYTVGGTLDGDHGFGLVYKLGTIPAGDSTVISYAYLFNSNNYGIDSAFPDPQMVVNGTIVDSLDTFSMCAHPGMTILPVNIIHATDKNWTWSKWFWTGGTGLATTTGVTNSIDLTALSADTTTFTIYGNDTAAGTMTNCQTRVFKLTIILCFGAINNGPLCPGDLLRLDAIGDSAGATYSWTGPGGFTSTLHHPTRPFVTYADSGIYTVVRTMGGMHDTARTTVAIHWKPTIFITTNSPLCSGALDTLNMSAAPDSAGETFSWTGPNSFTSTLDSPKINGFLAIDTGYYTVVATSMFGCKDTVSTHVVLAPPLPTPIISGITTYCTGETFVPFTVTGLLGTLLWYTSDTGTISSLIAPTVNTTIGGTYTFWASQAIGRCESPKDSITVTVHVTPTPPLITGTSVYCQYYTYIPPTAAGTNILWYTAASGGVGSPIAPTVNTSIPGVTTIYATQSDSGCESARAPFTITVNPKPVLPVVIDSPSNYCPGQAFVPFTVISGAGILWYTAATGGVGSPVSPTMNTSTTGTYTIWVSQTVLGCESDRSSVTITVYDSVTSGFTYMIKYGCSSDTVIFANTSTGTSNYVWSFGDGTSSISTNPVHIYTMQAIDSVKLLSNSASCIDSAKAAINLIHPIQAAFIGSPKIICQNQVDTFTNNSIGTTPTYVWYFGDGGTSTLINPTHNYPHTGTYTVTLIETDFVPCKDTATQLIYVDTISPIHIELTDSIICHGTYITLTGLYSDIGNTGITWNLGNGDMMQNVNPLMFGYEGVGTFTVTAIAHYRACRDTGASRVITVYQQPVISLGTDTSICPGSEAIALIDNTNASNGNASWLWNTGQKTAAIMISEPGLYIATVTIDGCTATDSILVKNDCYLNVSNVFTPNGDGINDYFCPRQFLSSGLTQFKMDIYNRWGELIFEATAIDGRGWDGRFNDVDQPEGVYIYMIDGTFKDGRHEHHQGNLTLLR